MTLAHTRQHYEAAATTAAEHQFIAQLRLVAAAQADAERADVRCQKDDYERVHKQRDAEVKALRPLADQLGLPLHYLREAFNG